VSGRLARRSAPRQRVGEANLAADGSVAAELSRWLDEREIDMSITGLASYRDDVRAYVVPHIGGMQLFSLNRDVIHSLYKTLLRSGGRRGGPLAASTVRTVHQILHKAFKDLGLEITGIRQPKKPQKLDFGRKGVWTAEETIQFLAAVKDDRLYAAWVLAVVCGLRRGELAGLRWSKVDLVRGVVRTDWQRTTATGQGEAWFDTFRNFEPR
jgi:integrase